MSEFGPSKSRAAFRPKVPACAALVLIMAAALVLAACEAPGVPHPLAGSVPPASGAMIAVPDASQSEPSPEGGGSSPVMEGRVEIELADFKITPNEFTVRAGDITFAFENAGRYTHDFRIEGEEVDMKAPKIGARRSREWSVTLSPGTYRISCPISNHDQRGMEGTLVVVD